MSSLLSGLIINKDKVEKKQLIILKIKDIISYKKNSR